MISTTVSSGLGRGPTTFRFALGHCGYICARRDVAKDRRLFRIAAVGIGFEFGVAGCGLYFSQRRLPEDSEERQDLVIEVLYRLVFHQRLFLRFYGLQIHARRE